MSSKKQFIELYQNSFLPVYADLTAYLSDKPAQVLVQFENICAHLICYFENPSSSIGKENLKKAHNHLIRLTLDCYKILWIEMNRHLENILRSDKHFLTLNLPNSDARVKYAEFKFLAKEARKEELRSVGIDPMASLEKYKNAIDVGWSLLRSKDDVKFTLIQKYKIIFFLKTQTVGIIIGLAVGLATSYIGNWIFSIFPP